MRAVMVKVSCLEADRSLGLSLAPPARLSWRGSFELTGLGDTKVDPCDAAYSVDHKICGHRSQPLSSYTFV
jgi:hypothetical protein